MAGARARVERARKLAARRTRSRDGGVRDAAELRELGERLESHIRHEERVVFPMIEQTLPTEDFERLGAAFACPNAEHQ
jgi:iron-sulfur cluster repair protein YtfE (RIC family)